MSSNPEQAGDLTGAGAAPEEKEGVVWSEKAVNRGKELAEEIKKLYAEIDEKQKAGDLMGVKAVSRKIDGILAELEEIGNKEKTDERFDEKEKVYSNIVFKKSIDRKTGQPSYISRGKGRPMIALAPGQAKFPAEGVPCKAKVVNKSSDGKIIYVEIVG